MQASAVFRLFLYLAETWGEYVKASEQNIYGAKKITLPKTECYVVFTGERKDKPDVISLFDEFLAPLARGCQRAKRAADEDRVVDLKVRVIFASEADTRSEGCECGGASAKSMDILQQYIAFSKECDRQFAQKGRTIEALKAAIEICKSQNILREYLEAREKDVIKIMTMLFDQGYVNEIACKESREEGAYDTKVTTARNLLALGVLSIEQIAQVTGLPYEEVASLA